MTTGSASKNGWLDVALVALLAWGAWTYARKTSPDSNTTRAPAGKQTSERITDQVDRGRHAETPQEIPVKGWKDIVWRVKAEVTDDRVGLIAAGTTFYLLLALFPALAALVSLYSLVLDPLTLQDHLIAMSGLLPVAALGIIEEQLRRLVGTNDGALGLAFLFSLSAAVWSANAGIKSLFEAMNIAYDEREERGFFRLNAISLCFTFGALVILVGLLAAVAGVPVVLEALYLGQFTESLVLVLRWPLLFGLLVVAIALIYRYGPSRAPAKWRWISWGAVGTAAIWIGTSAAFSWYLTNFANYNETYGSLGAVIGLMMWIWVSVFILMLGAEFNAEIEHQTYRDSTTGPPELMGERGATMADTIGKAVG